MVRMTLKALAMTVAGVVFFGGTAMTARADDVWPGHPRRAEVNARLANQNERIHEERMDGQINGAQAARLHSEDHAVHQEERLMASQDHGHITRSEQHVLNQQENAISRQIGP
jgi:hypothetical protein